MNEDELTYGETIKQPFPELGYIEWVMVEAPEWWGKKDIPVWCNNKLSAKILRDISFYKNLHENSKDFKVTWKLKQTNPHAEIKAEYEKAIAEGKIVKVFCKVPDYPEYKKYAHPSWHKDNQYKLRYYNIDWNKLLSLSYANGEFIKVHVSDYEWLGASVHYGVLTSYFVGSFGIDNICNRWKCCRLAKGVEIKDEWLKEIK